MWPYNMLEIFQKQKPPKTDIHHNCKPLASQPQELKANLLQTLS